MGLNPKILRTVAEAFTCILKEMIKLASDQFSVHQVNQIIILALIINNPGIH